MFGNIKGKLKISQGKKNVAKLSFGTLMGQGISFVTLPIFTRIYGTEVIGIWTVLQSIAIIINSFSDLGFTNALMVEKDEDKILCIYKVVSSIVFIVALLSGFVLLIYYSNFNKKGVSSWFIGVFIFVAVFTLQQIQICYTWLNRNGKYQTLMKNPIINNVTFGVIGITLGLIGYKSYGYYIGWILGQFLTLIHMKKQLPNELFTFNIEDYKYVFSKYIKFLKYQMPTNIISNFKNQLPILCISGFYGSKILGYYSISVKILYIPITLLASAVGRVFFQKTSEMKRLGQNIGNYVYKNLSDAMKIGALPMIGIMSAGDIIITVFFGELWKPAGIIIRILALQNFFMFLMMTVQGLSITLDKQNYAMVSSVAQSIGYIFGLFIGKYVFNSIYIGVAIMGLLFVIINIIYFSMMFKVMEISPKKYLFNVLSYILIMFAGTMIIRAILLFVGLVTSI